ncbi:phosphatidylglycerophosphatase A [Arsenophonus symbiont of Ornithomya chloropus]|uniref:phosphatidylglycerophosphatase A n=1 Tax=Arsenophonus symbiont of Ornithomya chloropus TaxID=634121 RepID=UPI0032B114EB
MNKKYFLTIFHPLYFFGTGFGSGFSPLAPGTIGSLISIPFWLLMHWLLSFWWCCFFIVFCFLIGILICQKISDDMKVYDHSSIVWDEFVGMWLTLMSIYNINLVWVLIAFMIFRFFDILKPWPIIWFHKKILGGFGIMFDDVIAAFFSVIILLILQYFVLFFSVYFDRLFI